MKESIKKLVTKISMLGIILSSVLALSGCDEYKSDEKYKEEKIAQVIDSLASRDPEKVKNLFAANAIKVIPNLDETITELLKYYKGDYISDEWMGSGSRDKNSYNVITKDIDFSLDITTSEDVYRVAVTNYRAKDTGDKNNIGLWQFFIIRYEDHPTPQYSYWGDWSKEPGLFIGTYHDDRDA
jgi:hypothetical protein